MASKSRVGAKARKFIRDPKQFLMDAVANRIAPDAGLEPRSGRPYVWSENVSGRDSTRGFSANGLLEGLSRQVPILQTVSAEDLRFGLLEKHLVLALDELLRFAATYGLILNLQVGKVRESPLLGLSEELLQALRKVSWFQVRMLSANSCLLKFDVFIYRLQGEILACRAPVMMKSLPKRASQLVWEAEGGMFWPTELLGGNVDPEREPEIDIVYTWVDSSDPGWRALHEGYFGGAIDEDRYSSREELRYSLRSVQYYCDWVRKIHIVSNCSPPPWLDVSDPRIEWVDHSQILPDQHLPTFNCHAIETGFLRIPDLAPKFLYFNDDFFVTNAQRPTNFFDRTGRSCSFFEGGGKLVPDRLPEEQSWFLARLNGQKALLARYNYPATYIHHHSPYVVDRDVCAEMFETFRSDVDRIAAARVRCGEDIPLTSFLYGHYAVVTGRGIARDVKAQILDFGNYRKFVLDDATDFLCINDGGGSADDHSFVDMTTSFMRSRFPFPASWEK